jgi:saccharopine dehydrogenase-like NADP-dependent oxidoreductase
MKQVLLFGAGKSATVLIDYLLSHAKESHWKLTVADANLESARSKIGNSPHGLAVSFDIADEQKRKEYIGGSDIVISMLPPNLHFLVAKNCVEYSKHLLTASYVDEQIKGMQKEIAEKGILFLCEMGLDPGIDHMSAMKIIDEIQAESGRVVSFK